MSSSRASVRHRVIQLLDEVQRGKSLQHLLDAELEQLGDSERKLLQEMVMGTLRHWYPLEKVANTLTGNKKLDPKVKSALLGGLYQLFYMRQAEHAVINETVNAIKKMRMTSAAGLVNAVLRRAIREKPRLVKLLAEASLLPDWLDRRLKQQWPEHYSRLAPALGEMPPVFLRVNPHKTTNNAYLQQLEAEGIPARPARFGAIQLLKGLPVSQLPGYREGWFSVQDQHAQALGQVLPASLASLNVIDCCAAPGGKTALMLEHSAPDSLTAFDLDNHRLQRVHQNLERLGLAGPNVHILQADALTYQPADAADLIVVDAPCTATGVIRRHPDIMLLRQPDDVQQTVELQRQILDRQWQNVRPGGQLIYITCSLLQEENEQQVLSFLDRHPDARETEIPAFNDERTILRRPAGYQFLPATGEGDGFYYALLNRNSTHSPSADH